MQLYMVESRFDLIWTILRRCGEHTTDGLNGQSGMDGFNDDLRMLPVLSLPPKSSSSMHYGFTVRAETFLSEWFGETEGLSRSQLKTRIDLLPTLLSQGILDVYFGYRSPKEEEVSLDSLVDKEILMYREGWLAAWRAMALYLPNQVLESLRLMGASARSSSDLLSTFSKEDPTRSTLEILILGSSGSGKSAFIETINPSINSSLAAPCSSPLEHSALPLMRLHTIHSVERKRKPSRPYTTILTEVT